MRKGVKKWSKSLLKKASKIDAIWLYLFRLLMKGIVEQTHG